MCFHLGSKIELGENGVDAIWGPIPYECRCDGQLIGSGKFTST